jgi:hypothetical protein
MPRYLGLGGARLRALGPGRLRAYSVTLAPSYVLDPDEPSVIPEMEVIADMLAGGVFSDEAGTTPQSSHGSEVKAWENLGTLGGLLVSTGFDQGPLFHTAEAVDCLNCVPVSASSARILGLDVSSGPDSNVTMYFVVKGMFASGLHSGMYFASLNGNTNGTAAFAVQGHHADWQLGVGGTNDSLGTGNDPAMLVDERFHVLCFRRTAGVGNAGTWDVFCEGVKVANNAATNVTTIARFNVGGAASNIGGNVKLTFAGFARTAAHDDATVLEVSEFLADRYADLLPRDKVCVWCGDSTSCSSSCSVSNADATWAPSHYNLGAAARALPSLDALWSNSWIGKNTSAHRTAAQLATIAGLLNTGGSKKILAIKSGVNDMLGGASAATTFDRITGLIGDIRALVPDVVVLVEVPTDADPGAWGAGYPALRASLLTLITDAGNQATHGYTCGTFHLDPVGLEWGNGARSSTYFKTSDGLHEVGPGNDRSGAVFATDLGALL